MKGPWSLKMLYGQHRVVRSGLTCCRNRDRGFVCGEGLPWLRDNVLDGIYFPVMGRGWMVAIQAV